jgi:hypothetical protein
MFDASGDGTTSPSLRETQRAFFRALVDVGAPGPEFGEAPGLGADARMSIYRTAYRARLTSVLRSDHPTVAAYLGRRFDGLASTYATTQPSRVRSLRDFGDGFPDFLADAQGVPARALARFERTLLDVFDAPDASQVEESAFEGVSSEGASLLGLTLHPSVRVCSPGWTVVPLWHAHRSGEQLPPLEADETPWLLWRGRDRRTQFRAMGTAEAALIRAALAGEGLASMCLALLDVLEPSDVPSFVAQRLRAWVGDGLVSGLRTTHRS